MEPSLAVFTVLCCLLLPNPLCLADDTKRLFEAGVGKREITPPPGFPTGGHGPAGDISRGYWNRLFARVFYIGHGQGHGLILASCDFFAFPLGLNAEVWKRVSAKAPPLGLGPQSLVLAATHTHQGPGNYLTARAYNEYGSSESGFSKDLFEFLARQISDAVKTALDSRPATLRLYSRQVTPDPKDQFILNRSPAVFAMNWDRGSALARLNPDRPFPCPKPPCSCEDLRRKWEPTEGWNLPDCPRLNAVDRRMRILELIDARDGAKMGKLIFVGTSRGVVFSMPVG